MRNLDGSPAAGTWCRDVCWLVRPTVVDCQIPDDHTIMWILVDPTMTNGMRVPQKLAWSIDREYIEEMSKQFYRQNRPHLLMTKWHDPEGRVVKKAEAIQRAAEPYKVVDLITKEEHVERQLMLKEREL